ncbi:MAG: hypothetical protein ACLQVM_02735 [Terriglobia bacterium]
MTQAFCTVALIALAACAQAQTAEPEPRIVTRPDMATQVTTVEVGTHFVTAIRLPEIISSVAVGDPTLFEVEHSEREPQLLFVKVLTANPAKTNVLISTAKGHQVSLLVVSKGGEAPSAVDFLVNYQRERSFIIEPTARSMVIPETIPVTTSQPATPETQKSSTQGSSAPSIKPLLQEMLGASPEPALPLQQGNLDKLLEREVAASLPTLYGGHPQSESERGDQVRAGVGQVIDGGQEVAVLFSVVNPQKQDILLMPPQIQLGGKTNRGKLFKHSKWTTAEQMPVMDYRLSKRRLAPSERADGVVLFARPPYKQSNETLFLQMAQAGAIDHPALAPIGFGISTSEEDNHVRTKPGN